MYHPRLWPSFSTVETASQRVARGDRRVLNGNPDTHREMNPAASNRSSNDLGLLSDLLAITEVRASGLMSETQTLESPCPARVFWRTTPATSPLN